MTLMHHDIPVAVMNTLTFNISHSNRKAGVHKKKLPYWFDSSSSENTVNINPNANIEVQHTPIPLHVFLSMIWLISLNIWL